MPDDPAAVANAEAWEVLGRWQKPVLTLFSASFAGSNMGPERLIAHIPGARDQDHALIGNASFYIIEDSPDDLARHVVAFMVLGQHRMEFNIRCFLPTPAMTLGGNCVVRSSSVMRSRAVANEHPRSNAH